MKIYYVFLITLMWSIRIFAQDSGKLDSILKLHTSEINTLKKVKLSGYFQPQFQVAQSKGTRYPGGDFGAEVNKRFSVRRARLRVTYTSKPFEMVLVTENTERSFSLHDVYGSYTMDKIGLKYTAGLFPRPFGFEQTYSTANHEAPERARFSTTLLPAEADIGFKLSYLNLKPFTIEAGVYNGNSTASDFDSYKDFVAKIGFDKKLNTSNLSGGISFYHGAVIQGTKYLFETETIGDKVQFVLQDTFNNTKGSGVLRQYIGADLQYTFNTTLGATTLRAEWVGGTQPGYLNTTDSPRSSALPTTDTYSRKFNAFSSYFLHMIGETNLQLLIKYDWYDPNTDVDANDIGVADSRLTASDIKYNTLGFGINYYYQNIRVLLYYDIITNEKTPFLAAFQDDLEDNVLTIRTHFKF